MGLRPRAGMRCQWAARWSRGSRRYSESSRALNCRRPTSSFWQAFEKAARLRSRSRFHAVPSVRCARLRVPPKGQRFGKTVFPLRDDALNRRLMKLENLLTVDALSDARFAALDVRGITADSRIVKPGDLFVAVSGTKADGLRFVEAAINGGAVAIMAE